MDKKYCNMKLYWVVTIWPKWQIVIPKDIREKLDIKTGDYLAVIIKDDKYLWFIKNEHMWELMKYVESEKTNIN